MLVLWRGRLAPGGEAGRRGKGRRPLCSEALAVVSVGSQLTREQGRVCAECSGSECWGVWVP